MDRRKHTQPCLGLCLSPRTNKPPCSFLAGLCDVVEVRLGQHGFPTKVRLEAFRVDHYPQLLEQLLRHGSVRFGGLGPVRVEGIAAGQKVPRAPFSLPPSRFGVFINIPGMVQGVVLESDVEEHHFRDGENDVGKNVVVPKHRGAGGIVALVFGAP